MQPLIIDQTTWTPAIYFDANQNLLRLQGKSYPENARAFYAPVFAWLQDYLAQIDQDVQVIVQMNLPYYNSSSDRILAELFDLLNEKAFNDSLAIDVYWQYEADNQDSLENGQEFQADYRAMIFHFVLIDASDNL